MEQLLKGTYQPQPVRQVEILKPGGKGVRKLGIPVALDRFIQQAVLQVLQERIDSTFSENSFGFRPGRSAHQAIAKAQEYMAQGYRFVVDIDLEKFFDTVNHDKLMSEIAKRITDKRVLKLIRAFLKVGILKEGKRIPSEGGTQQGSPLSPLLSNILLDLLDKELERRGHCFCRYADDCNVYVKSERAGQRVMASLRTLLATKLKLKVNEQKSAVSRGYRRSFLGFSFTSGNTPKRRIAPEAIKRFKKKVREYTRAGKGMNMEKVMVELSKYLKGWLSYFGFCQTLSVLKDLEGWVHRHLRCAFWRQWRHGKNKGTQLRRLGVGYKLSISTAGTNKGPWHTSNSPALCIALSGKYFKNQGLPKFVQ
jgi:RNA-directed DNA polymerase